MRRKLIAALAVWFSGGTCPTVRPAVAQDFFVPLRTGSAYEVSTKSSLEGTLDLPAGGGKPARKVAVIGTSRAFFRERVLEENREGVRRTFRLYDEVENERRVDDQDQEAKLRATVKRVVLERQAPEKPPLAYSPDVPLLWTELDLIKTHPFVPALEGFLNAKAEVGAVWRATRPAIVELLALDPYEDGQVTCKLLGTIEHKGKQLLQVAFEGQVIGVTVDGRARNTVQGAAYVDAATRRLASLRARGTRELFGPQNAIVGKIVVDYQIIVKPLTNDPDLADNVVAALPKEPNDELTALTYEHPGLGVRIRHPRRWLLATVRQSDLILESPSGSLQIHLEPESKTPTTAAYSEQVQQFFEKNKIPMLEKAPPREKANGPERVGNFRIRATVEGKERILDYWTVERGKRGATLASKLDPATVDKAAADIAFIARHLEFFEPLKPAAEIPAKAAPKPAP